MKAAKARFDAAVEEEVELGKMVKVSLSAFVTSGISGYWWSVQTDILQAFRDAIKLRERYWKAERGRFAQHANCVFIFAMEKRDLEAMLQFEHDIGRLSIRVSPSRR